MLKPITKLELVKNKPGKPYFAFNELVVRNRHGQLVKPSCNQFRAGPICRDLGIKVTNPDVLIALQEHVDNLFSHKIFFDFVSLLFTKAEAGLIRQEVTTEELEGLRHTMHKAELDLQNEFNRLCDTYPGFEKVFTYVKTKKT